MAEDEYDETPSAAKAANQLIYRLGGSAPLLQERLEEIEQGLQWGGLSRQLASQEVGILLDSEQRLRNRAIKTRNPRVRALAVAFFDRQIEGLFAFAEQHGLAIKPSPPPFQSSLERGR